MTDSDVSLSGLNDRPSPSDDLGFRPYVDALTEFLTDSETETPLTISIEGEWGAGKSTFMALLQTELEDRGYETVVFNPWRHQAEEMWAVFMLEFLRQLSKRRSRRQRLRSRLALIKKHLEENPEQLVPFAASTFVVLLAIVAATILGWALGPEAANAVLTEFGFEPAARSTAGGITGTIGFFASVGTVWYWVRRDIAMPLESKLRAYRIEPRYEDKLSLLTHMHRDLKQTLDAYNIEDPIFVFIDDLDRCSVPRSAELMESLNLLFSDDDRLVYLLGMDRKLVAAGIEAKYEKLIEFLKKYRKSDARVASPGRFGHEFIEKFIQVPFLIPRPGSEAFRNLISDASDSNRFQGAPSPDTAPAQVAPNGGSSGIDETELDHPQSPPVTRDDIEQAIGWAARVFEQNPRRMKRFINLYRLRIQLATELEMLEGLQPDSRPADPIPTEFAYRQEDEKVSRSEQWEPTVQEGMVERRNQVTSAQLGKFVIISIRWPGLLPKLNRQPKLLGELTKIGLRRKHWDEIHQELMNSATPADEDQEERMKIPKDVRDLLPKALEDDYEFGRLLDLLTADLYDESTRFGRVEDLVEQFEADASYEDIGSFFEDIDPARFQELTGADSDYSLVDVGVQGLLRISPRADDPTETIEDDLPVASDTLFERAREQLEQKNYEEARELFHESLLIDSELDDYNNVVANLNGLGLVALRQGDYVAAREYFEESLETNEKFLHDRSLATLEGEAVARKNLGNIEFDREDWSGARDQYEKAVSIYEQLEDQTEAAYTRFNLGLVQSNLDRYEDARTHLKECLSCFRELEDRRSEADVLRNLGHISFDLEEYATARDEYKESLAVLEELDTRGDEDVRESRANLLLHLGDAILRLDDPETAHDRYEESRYIFEEIGKPSGQGHAILNIGNVEFEQPDYESARECYEDCLAIFEELDDPRDVAVTRYNLGNVEFNLNDYEAARRHYKKSLALYEDLDQPKDVAESQLDLADIDSLRAEYDVARERCEESLEIYQELEDDRGVVNARTIRGWIAFFRGDFDAARKDFKWIIKNVSEQNDVSWRAHSQSNAHRGLGWIAFRESSYPQAKQHFLQAEASIDSLDERRETLGGRDGLGWVAVREGDYPTARGHFEWMCDLGRDQRNSSVGYGFEGLGWIAFYTGSLPAARDHFEESLSIFKETSDPTGEVDAHVGLGWVALEERELSRAREAFESTRAFGHEVGDPYREARGLRGLGEVSLERGAYQEAEYRFRESLERFEEIGHLRGEAACRAGLARCAAHRGEDESARDQLEDAYRIRRTIGTDLGETYVTIERIVTDVAQADDTARAFEWAVFALGLIAVTDEIETRTRRFDAPQQFRHFLKEAVETFGAIEARSVGVQAERLITAVSGAVHHVWQDTEPDEPYVNEVADIVGAIRADHPELHERLVIEVPSRLRERHENSDAARDWTQAFDSSNRS